LSSRFGIKNSKIGIGGEYPPMLLFTAVIRRPEALSGCFFIANKAESCFRKKDIKKRLSKFDLLLPKLAL
jgi:hypothetical protein